ncbi:ATP-grasp domain-containing protein [Defluviitoga tunisiensis]|uniref:ATP-grasp domain protein n=1 Tax=Defluviitoga tunisiensis TaxID=1006576 RepID=A0A0C7NR69_DEFTU|nr:ATP-grasp domain-containing protein [Defluviitoga tunisiensis]CEP78317.1 ATP-grasp domain protein [Defluviitoga tunisiensis]HOP25529.1 ATP-grasp domain-containing protein [Defluviitoga sp.]
MNTKKKILVLGVGSAQFDLIVECKCRGLEVHGCSNRKEGRGLAFVDKFVLIDIKDVESVMNYVQQMNIDYVYSIGSDIALPTISYVNEKLNLPNFVSYETAIICHNKSRLRETLGENFEGNIPFVVGSSFEDFKHWNIFPAIMKPVDSQGQRGVLKVNNFSEIIEYFEKSSRYSQSKKVIVEKYIPSDEISVNAYVVDGEVKFKIVSDRIVFDEYPGGLVKEHRMPSKYYKKQEVIDRIEKLVVNTINVLRIKNGPVYFQIKIDNDMPYLIEVTPRLDGCHMWRLIYESTGVNLLKITVDHLMGEKITDDVFEVRKIKPKVLKFICMPPNSVFNTSEYDNKNVFWYYKNNEVVKEINGYFEKVGYYIESSE